MSRRARSKRRAAHEAEVSDAPSNHATTCTRSSGRRQNAAPTTTGAPPAATRKKQRTSRGGSVPREASNGAAATPSPSHDQQQQQQQRMRAAARQVASRLCAWLQWRGPSCCHRGCYRTLLLYLQSTNQCQQMNSAAASSSVRLVNCHGERCGGKMVLHNNKSCGVRVAGLLLCFVCRPDHTKLDMRSVLQQEIPGL